MINLGIIGGGQLAYMLCESAIKLDSYINNIYIFSDKKDISCNKILNDKIHIFYGKYNINNITNFCKKCDILTYEFEDIDISLFSDINIEIYPKLNLLEIIQDKYIQKKYLADNKINIGPFDKLDNKEDLYNFIKIYNYPVIIKKRKGSFDGRGNIIINNEKDIEAVEFDIIQYYVEDFIDFDNELSICGCKSNKGIINYEPVINIHKNSILIKTEYNRNILTKGIINKIKNIYHSILKLFDTKGVICVEFFQKDDSIFINEIALRVHNTYHISLDCCNISQFDMHIMNILDLDIIHPKFIRNGIMYNIISNMQELDDITKLINKNDQIVIKKYHKKDIGIRKIGHVNIIN